MNDLASTIEQLKHSNIQKTIRKRIQEFKHVDKDSADALFNELCFCILTANYSAKRTIQIHMQLYPGYCTETRETLSTKLKAQGYRFPNIRAAYIKDALMYKNQLPAVIKEYEGEEQRTWLVDHIPGIGLKEASHFLRNIGFDDYAIIDSHILDVLERYSCIKKPRTLTTKKYREIEQLIQGLATHTSLTCAELDLYLWYLETGTILK